MVTEVRWPAFRAPSDEPLDPTFVADLRAGRVECDCTWPEVLAMAVKDGAVSVQYHPWRTDRGADWVLSYVVGGTRYGLIRPPAQAAGRLLTDAHRLLRPGLASRLFAGRSVTGRVRLVGDSGATEWIGVCWSNAGVQGVEWHQIMPISPDSTGAEPNRPPDRGGTE